MKKSALFALLFLLVGYESLASDTASVIKPRKFRYGLFTSLDKEYVHSEFITSNSPHDKTSPSQGTSLGLSFRYRFSKTFSLYGGLAASVYTQEYIYQGLNPSPQIVTSWGRDRRFSYQIPVYLQVNVYKERFFASAGFELYEVLRNTHEFHYKVMAQGAEKTTKESSNYGLLESQLILGAGWNFKAFNHNDFTLELLTKTYFLNNYASSPGFNYILSPSLKLNWYFKRK
ncbi:MAG: hypothetical protein V4561_07055 [Bacteroidota bacterium]